MFILEKLSCWPFFDNFWVYKSLNLTFLLKVFCSRFCFAITAVALLLLPAVTTPATPSSMSTTTRVRSIQCGGKFDILSQDLRGLNILINPPFSQQRTDPLTGKADHIIIRIIDKLCATKSSELPTRAVVIVPALPGPGGDRFRQYAREKKLIEFLDFPPDSLRFQAPQSFAHEQPYFPGTYKSSVSVFLFMNNRSLLYDPIDWPRTRNSLRDWLSQHCPEGKIVSEADKKFGERVMSEAPPRQSAIVPQTCPVLTLMSALPQKQCQRSLRKQVGKRLKQVNAINSGYRQAATIGLFPHALANMVKEKYPTEGLSMMDNLSRMVIRACAARFQEYQRLTVISEAHRTAYGKPNVHKCLDPFHFLEVSPSSPRQRATCHCDIVKGVKRSQKQPGNGKRKKRKTKKGCNLPIGPGSEVQRWTGPQTHD